MSREWVDALKGKPKDRRWVMRCDTFYPSGKRCRTEGEPSLTQPELEQYVTAGWFIGKVYGDMCPKCLAAGYQPSSEPHQLMKEATK